MMRTIKFRAWHTEKEVMFTAEEMAEDQLCLLPTGNFINIHPYTRLSQILPKEKLIPLQSTGLRDINGKEIYEGDIVKENQGRSTAVIEWFFGGLVSKNEFGRRMHIGLFLREYLDELENSNVNFLEVVGNIYEHPSLFNARAT